MHFFAPTGLLPMGKDILFILDRSGSMSGTPLKQVKKAMKNILLDLRETDRFIIIFFDDRPLPWKEEFVPVTNETIREAITFIESTNSGGSKCANHRRDITKCATNVTLKLCCLRSLTM